MRNQIEALFPICNVNNCIEEVNSIQIIIHDNPSDNRSYIYKSKSPLEYPKFTIDNPSCKNISFLAIDNCLLFSHDGEKCDFAAFDEKNLVFVEIKKGGSIKYRSDKKKDAVSQLRNTLIKFNPIISSTPIRIYACVCVGYFDRSPAAAAADLNLLVEFINDYNTELIEGNQFQFD